MHTRINLDMYREIGNAFTSGSLNQFFKQVKTVHFRLQFVVEHGFKCRKFRIHNDYRTINSGLTQVCSFIGYCHSQIIYTVILQRLRYLKRTCSISRSFNHTYHFCIWLKLITIIIQIVDQSLKIDLKNRFVHFQLQQICNIIEMEHTSPFY